LSSLSQKKRSLEFLERGFYASQPQLFLLALRFLNPPGFFEDAVRGRHLDGFPRSQFVLNLGTPNSAKAAFEQRGELIRAFQKVLQGAVEH